MPKPTKAQQLFDELLSRYGQSIADAFQKAVDDLRANVDLQRVIAAVQANDLNAAITAMHLDPAALAPLEDVISAAFTAGGQAVAQTMPAMKDRAGNAVVIRFNGRNLRAEQWLKAHSSQLVTDIVQDQRTSVRNALTAGMQKGQNPRTVALDVVGRIDPATGKREGGIIGLTSIQEDYARTAADELASGDPAQLRNYLTRGRRDKRFDRAVQKAIDSQQPVPADIAAKAVRNYRNQLLRLRGETIGKHEAFASLSTAKHEAYTQATERGDIAAAAVTKKWRHFANEHPREQHVAMAGKKVGLRDPFILPDGTRMLYPHDPSAPASQTLGCHCAADYEISFLDNLD
jgi:hypothetical protein